MRQFCAKPKHVWWDWWRARVLGVGRVRGVVAREIVWGGCWRSRGVDDRDGVRGGLRRSTEGEGDGIEDGDSPPVSAGCVWARDEPSWCARWPPAGTSCGRLRPPSACTPRPDTQRGSIKGRPSPVWSAEKPCRFESFLFKNKKINKIIILLLFVVIYLFILFLSVSGWCTQTEWD